MDSTDIKARLSRIQLMISIFQEAQVLEVLHQSRAIKHLVVSGQIQVDLSECPHMLAVSMVSNQVMGVFQDLD